MSNGLSQLLETKPRGPASGQKTLDNSVLSSLKEGFSEQVKSIKETTKSENPESENPNVGSNGIWKMLNPQKSFQILPLQKIS